MTSSVAHEHRARPRAQLSNSSAIQRRDGPRIDSRARSSLAIFPGSATHGRLLGVHHLPSRPRDRVKACPRRSQLVVSHDGPVGDQVPSL